MPITCVGCYLMCGIIFKPSGAYLPWALLIELSALIQYGPVAVGCKCNLNSKKYSALHNNSEIVYFTAKSRYPATCVEL